MISVWDNAESGAEGTLKRIQYLSGHRTTVVATCFFSVGSDRFLLSSGKDRQLRIWKLVDRKFEGFLALQKAHSRIVWDCDVAFSGESSAILLTASRDGCVKAWEFCPGEGKIRVGTEGGDHVKEVGKVELGESVTAVAASKMKKGEGVAVVCGTENGMIRLYRLKRNGETVNFEQKDEVHCGKQINSIEWLPVEKLTGVKRTEEEYFEKSVGNCVVGCQNGGVYLFQICFFVC